MQRKSLLLGGFLAVCLVSCQFLLCQSVKVIGRAVEDPSYRFIRSAKTNISHYAANQLQSQEYIDRLLGMVDKISNASNREDITFPVEPQKVKYLSHRQLTKSLMKIADKFKTITRLYSIGKSVQGKTLWVLEISDNPGKHEPGEPEFQYTGNLHGNEVVSRSLVLNLANLLCENYGQDEMLTQLVNYTRIHLLPTANPDGFAKAFQKNNMSEDVDQLPENGRWNDHDVDLNRDFPFHNSMSYKKAESEARALMDWLHAYHFVLAADLHGGNLVADYPFDAGPGFTPQYSATPDDAAFRWLAESYSLAHPWMHTGDPCPEKKYVHYDKGILNGATYYNHPGPMLDWNYLHTDCLQIAVEVGCTKYPAAQDLPQYWQQHKYSLLVFMAQVHKGIKGFIQDAETGAGVAGAAVMVANNSHIIRTTALYGDYWRLLPPGNYNMSVIKTGYETVYQTVTVTDGAAAIVNVQLTRTPGFPWNVVSSNPMYGVIAIAMIVLFVVIITVTVWRIYSCRSPAPRLVSLIELPRSRGNWSWSWRTCRNCNPCCKKTRRDISLSDYSAAVRLLTIESDASSDEEFSANPARKLRTPSGSSVEDL